MWIKICGNTTLEDAELAAFCGADAVGFIFAPSPRRVTVEVASRITTRLPQSVEKFGVFVDADFEEIVSIVERCRLTGVQLHSMSGLSARLRERFPRGAKGGDLSIVRVLHYNGESQNSGENENGHNQDAQLETELEALRQDAATDAVLVDSKTMTAVGGTGVSYDWLGARGIFSRAARHHRLIAAGGLRPENVAEAITTLQPWGVDVASGVETAPGRKDASRLKDFIATARRAATELSAMPETARA